MKKITENANQALLYILKNKETSAGCGIHRFEKYDDTKIQVRGDTST